MTVRPRTRIRLGPVLGGIFCGTDGNQSQGYREPGDLYKLLLVQIMADSAIIISSDSSDEWCLSFFYCSCYFFCAPMVRRLLYRVTHGLCGLVPYTGSDSDSPDEMTSPEHISPLPAISPFICTDSSEAPDSSDGPHGTPYVYLPLLLEERLLTARKRVGSLPARRLASRHTSPRAPDHHSSSSSSSSDSSPVHSLGLDVSDQAHSGSSTRDVPPRLCYPPRRAPRRKRPMHLSSHSAGPSRKRCRSPVDLAPLSMPVTGSLAPTRADLSPPRKRFRDSYSSEASMEGDAEVGLTGTGVDMELGIGDGDEIGDHVEIDHRDARDDTEEYEADASAGDTAEVGIDPMTAPLVEEEIVEPAGEDSPDSSGTRDGIVRSVEDTPVDLSDAVRDFYHHMSEVRVDRIVGIETAQRRLEEEFRQIRRDRDDARGRLRRLESYLGRRFGITIGNVNGNGNGIMTKEMVSEMETMEVKQDHLMYAPKCSRGGLMGGEIHWSLPDNIQGNVIACRTYKFKVAFDLPNNFDDQKLEGYANTGGQNVARAYVAGNNEERKYEGTLPLCNKCKLHHVGPCTTRCGKCNKIGHLTRNCRVTNPTTPTQRGQIVNQRVVTCFECGAQGHYQKDCPKIKNQNRGNKASVPDARGRAYALGGGDVNPGSNTVTGTFLLNDHHAYMLFDSGADKSFVSNTFSALLDITPYALDVSYAIELADGRTSETNTVLMGCTLGLLGHPFNIDLMPIELGSFDVIIGMDWLAKNHAVIVCDGRCAYSYGNDILIFKETNVTVKENKDKSNEKRLEDVPTVRDFPEVFPEDLPGLPPTRQVEFQIDLVQNSLMVHYTEFKSDAIGVITRRAVFMDFGDRDNFGSCSRKEVLYAKFLKIVTFGYEGYYFLDTVLRLLPTIYEGFSKIAKPMTKLTQKSVKFNWGEKEETDFQTLKQKLCSAPILALPEGSENFIVYCDASHKGLGAVLMQKEKVIAYASRHLKIYERTTRHMFGIGELWLFALRHQKELNMRQRRWLELLSDMDCEFDTHPKAECGFEPPCADLNAQVMGEKRRNLWSTEDLHCKGENDQWRKLNRQYLKESVSRHGGPVFDHPLIAIGRGQSERTIQTTGRQGCSSMYEDFRKGWDRHLSLIEFSYNNSYHTSIKTTPFEVLYGRKCRSPIYWAEVGDAQLTGPEIVHETTKKIIQIKHHLTKLYVIDKSAMLIEE
ncbi:putative reverse transcriptase domain-containing protein [Tanacetum coccineum]|uniref:Reverse transcriptase domain-containing protein n=1 Tax=Tanacetum coccineum TaxID=301880 RepID=A0ABQ5FT94_9ASTR